MELDLSEDLKIALTQEKRIVTAKWIAHKYTLPFLMAQRILNEFYRKNTSREEFHPSFIISRHANGGTHIQVVTINELQDNEGDADVFSLQPEAFKMQLVLALNSSIVIAPTIVNPNAQIPRINAPISAISVPVNVPVVKANTTETLIPTKTEAKAIENPLKGIVKKTKILQFTAAKKVSNVDLKDKLKSEMYTADAMMEDEDNNNVESKQLMQDDTGVVQAQQSFVTFSSDDDEDDDLAKNDLSVRNPSPMKTDPVTDPVIAISDTKVNSLDGEIPSVTLPIAPQGPKMKMIKVPKTFMENGYMVTEYVNEMVPDNENDEKDLNSPPLSTNNPTIKKTATTTKSTKEGTKEGTTKQKSLLNFFKPKQ